MIYTAVLFKQFQGIINNYLCKMANHFITI